MEIITRIVASKKAILASVGSLAMIFGAEAGLAQHITDGVGALFGLLVVAQGILDYKFGSKSDGTV